MIDDNETDTRTEDETMSARQRAIEAYESARGSVANAGRRAADGLTEAPFIALAGGIAAGVLPRTSSETRLVRPTARRVKDTARAAYKAARETGEQQLNELGLSREKGEETIRSLFKGVTDAAKASAQSALDTARTKR